MKKLGDRFGGVVFDLQELRRGRASRDEAIKSVRGGLLVSILTLIELVEQMDQAAIDRETNPRIGRFSVSGSYFNSDEARSARMAARDAGYERCTNLEHDRCGQRKTDCTECFPTEQASLTSSLANLNEIPVLNTDVQLRTLHDDREPRMHATICTCEAPLCNSDNTYPKACYSCGGLVVQK